MDITNRRNPMWPSSLDLMEIACSNERFLHNPRVIIVLGRKLACCVLATCHIASHRLIWRVVRRKLSESKSMLRRIATSFGMLTHAGHIVGEHLATFLSPHFSRDLEFGVELGIF